MKCSLPVARKTTGLAGLEMEWTAQALSAATTASSTMSMQALKWKDLQTAELTGETAKALFAGKTGSAKFYAGTLKARNGKMVSAKLFLSQEDHLATMETQLKTPTPNTLATSQTTTTTCGEMESAG